MSLVMSVLGSENSSDSHPLRIILNPSKSAQGSAWSAPITLPSLPTPVLSPGSSHTGFPDVPYINQAYSCLRDLHCFFPACPLYFFKFLLKCQFLWPRCISSNPMSSEFHMHFICFLFFQSTYHHLTLCIFNILFSLYSIFSTFYILISSLSISPN